MKSKLLHSFFGLVFALFGLKANAQTAMADGLRSEGKIYIVVGVLLIIVAGFLLYLFRVDAKISKIEKDLKSK